MPPSRPSPKPLRSSFVFFAAAAVVGLLAMAGCPGELENPERFLTGGATCPDIEGDLFINTCADSDACHTAAGAPAAGNLDLESPGVASRVVGVPGTATCMSTLLADPASPEDSLLITKLERMPPCGAPMPFGKAPLSEEERQCLIDWIAAQMGGGGGMGGSGNMGGMGGSGNMGGSGGAGAGGAGGAGGA